MSAAPFLIVLTPSVENISLIVSRRKFPWTFYAKMMCSSSVVQKYHKTACFVLFKTNTKCRLAALVNPGGNSWMSTNKVGKSPVQ